MKFISAEEIYSIGFPAIVEGLRIAHRGPVPLAQTARLQDGEGEARQSFLALPAWIPGEAMGVKMVSVLPGNEERHGLPNIQAAYQLFDGATGAPTLALDGTALTYVKTAADSALGADYLARRDVETMLMVGAGGLGPFLVDAHRAVRPSISRVLVWNRTASRAERLVERLRREEVEAHVVDDLDDAVSRADLVSCATATFEPLVKGRLVKTGAHVDLVGSFTPDMREADDDLARRSSFFVDTLWKSIGESGDIDGPIAAGVMTQDDLLADLYGLCRGEHPGRGHPDEITCFKNNGGGHLDLYVARAIERIVSG